jgi:hypothetical protein
MPGSTTTRLGDCGRWSSASHGPRSTREDCIEEIVPQPLSLRVLPGELAVCRLPADAPIAPLPARAPLVSITRTSDELSIVCRVADAPPAAQVEPGWRALQVAGPLDFALTGILAAIADPLAAAGISLFAVSTYDTDYVLVRETALPAAVAALRAAGHDVSAP